MSVENFDQLGGAVAFLDDATPENCFYCGRPLSGLTAFWHGADGRDVALHPDCGLDFGVRITRDALNAKMIGEGKSPAAGVSVGLSTKV